MARFARHEPVRQVLSELGIRPHQYVLEQRRLLVLHKGAQHTFGLQVPLDGGEAAFLDRLREKLS